MNYHFKIYNQDALEVLKKFVRYIRVSKSGCWEWTGARNSKGYPYIRVGRRTIGAHRVAHMLFLGQCKNGQVHHECMNQRCVCPTHLHDLTAEQNRHLQTIGSGDPSHCDVPF